MKTYNLFPLCSLLLLFSNNTLAHGGRLDANGCHGGSVPYHCHRAPSEMVSSSSGGSRLTCAAGSRSQDCYNDDSSISTPSYNSHSSESSDYFYKNGNSYFVRAKSYSNIYMNLYPSGHREVGFAIRVPLTNCTQYVSSSRESNIKINVGNDEMLTYFQCTGYKTGNIYPRYASDQKKLIRLFKDMKHVNLSVDSHYLSFNTMGFTRAFNEITK